MLAEGLECYPYFITHEKWSGWGGKCFSLTKADYGQPRCSVKGWHASKAIKTLKGNHISFIIYHLSQY